MTSTTLGNRSRHLTAAIQPLLTTRHLLAPTPLLATTGTSRTLALLTAQYRRPHSQLLLVRCYRPPRRTLT